jgi:outer membrane protein assembly factor BamB
MKTRHTAAWRESLMFMFVVLTIGVCSDVRGDMQTIDRISGGLCVHVGGDDSDLSLKLHQQGCGIVHRLDKNAERIAALRTKIAAAGGSGSVMAEVWPHSDLPYVDALADWIICEEPGAVAEEELLRVLRPGGTAFIRMGDGYTEVRKAASVATDEWTHPWHGPDGGLTSDDPAVGVPTGLQWLQGPLFAMAGRKSSTQSLLAAGGRIFCVTQNVVENQGRQADQMQQYLVAHNAYNGLLLWKRPWQGPFTRGEGELNPRMVATSDALYTGRFDGVQVLDAETGREKRYDSTPGPVSRLIVDGSVLLVQHDRGVQGHSLQAESGESPLWRFAVEKICGMAAGHGQLYLLTSGRRSDGRRTFDLICLGLTDGIPRWRIDTQAFQASEQLRICFAADGYVALIAHGQLHVVRAENGEYLWSRSTEARPGKSYADERYVGHFYRRGMIWMQLENSPREYDGQAVWVALDPGTGRELRRLVTCGPWPQTATPAKMGCQLILASDDYVMIPRQATFIDLSSGRKESFKFIRGGCGSGFVPAHGLLYSSPHACGCYTEAIRGLLAVHSRPVLDFDARVAPERRWEHFGADLPVEDDQPAAAEDWPMYRHDIFRSAKTKAGMPERLDVLWTTSVRPSSRAVDDAPWRLRAGMPLTAPTVADGRVFVGDVQGCQVLALDQRHGERLWRFTAGGRIDSPPTIFQGRCIFGTHDGYVYCLDAADGRLLWRYLAAPADKRMVAYGQLESVWPVAGSVLVQNGIAFVAAGRAPDADGGVRVTALDVQTGRQIWSTNASEGMIGVCDYLVGDSSRVYLANLQFDLETGKHRVVDQPSHLRGGKAGLLETSWTQADLALRKSIQDWSRGDSSGQLLAFDDQRTIGFRVSEDGVADLFAEGGSKWSQPVPSPQLVLSLAANDAYVAVAGANERFRTSAGGFLAIRQLDKGHLCRDALPLSAPPVVDGLAVAGGRIYLSLQDGSLIAVGRGEDSRVVGSH